MSWHGEAADARDPGTARRVVMPGERGPVLVHGPVEVVLDDGTTLRSDRPVVALCACGRSGRYPFCDTSHRRRALPPRSGSGSGSGSAPAAGSAPGSRESSAAVPPDGADRTARPNR